MRNEKGAALIIAVIVMGLLAALIIGFSTNTDIDLLVGRNSRILKQAFQWSDSGMEIAQDIISSSEYDANNSTEMTMNFNGTKLHTEISNVVYNATNATITLYENDSSGDTLALVEVKLLGSIINDGSSIIFASGYEGAGKGAGAGGTVARIYSLHSSGFADLNSTKRSAAIYRSVSSGK